MAQRLEQIAANANPARNVFLNHQRAELLRKKLSMPQSTKAQVDTRLEMALEYLRAGETETAISEFMATAPVIAQLTGTEKLQNEWFLERFLGLAYMRLGEQENCVARHTTESCLLPLTKDGIHEITHGSSNAISYFTAALRKNP